MSNILKTEAAQTKILTAQTSTNEAQTIEPVLGEFGACGGAGDVIAYNSMSNILKTEAAQTKILPAQTSTNEAQTNETIWGEFGLCGGAESPQNDLSQPAFQRCFTVETTSGTMVESTVNYLSILQNGSTLIL